MCEIKLIRTNDDGYSKYRERERDDEDDITTKEFARMDNPLISTYIIHTYLSAFTIALHRQRAAKSAHYRGSTINALKVAC